MRFWIIVAAMLIGLELSAISKVELPTMVIISLVVVGFLGLFFDMVEFMQRMTK